MDWRRAARLLPLVATLFLISCSSKTPTLNLLVWEGYADPSYVKAFEEQNHCKISASYMGSSDELVAKLRGGSSGNYDVISPSSDVATIHRDLGPRGSSRSWQDSQLQPALAAAHFPSAGACKRTGLRRAFHVGTRSDDL